MLWFDNDSKVNLDTKIARAAVYYRNKYGRAPNVCFVHPTMLPQTASDTTYVAGGVEVRSNRSVLPNHIWIGINE